MRIPWLLGCVLSIGVACASLPNASTAKPTWSIALHGGAGVIPKTFGDAKRERRGRVPGSAP